MQVDLQRMAGLLNREKGFLFTLNQDLDQLVETHYIKEPDTATQYRREACDDWISAFDKRAKLEANKNNIENTILALKKKHWLANTIIFIFKNTDGGGAILKAKRKLADILNALEKATGTQDDCLEALKTRLEAIAQGDNEEAINTKSQQRKDRSNQLAAQTEVASNRLKQTQDKAQKIEKLLNKLTKIDDLLNKENLDLGGTSKADLAQLVAEFSHLELEGIDSQLDGVCKREHSRTKVHELIHNAKDSSRGYFAPHTNPSLVKCSLELLKPCLNSEFEQQMLTVSEQKCWEHTAKFLAEPGIVDMVPYICFWSSFDACQEMVEHLDGKNHEDINSALLMEKLSQSFKYLGRKLCAEMGVPNLPSHFVYAVTPGVKGENNTGGDLFMVLDIDLGGVKFCQYVVLQMKNTDEDKVSVHRNDNKQLSTLLKQGTAGHYGFFQFCGDLNERYAPPVTIRSAYDIGNELSQRDDIHKLKDSECKVDSLNKASYFPFFFAFQLANQNCETVGVAAGTENAIAKISELRRLTGEKLSSQIMVCAIGEGPSKELQKVIRNASELEIEIQKELNYPPCKAVEKDRGLEM